MRRGLTLIELLVAVILCGIVVIISIQLISGEHANYTTTRLKVRLQSDAREAMRILEEEIKNAGYKMNAGINATTFELSASPCTQANYASNASFDPAPSYATGGVKALEIRFYNPSLSSTYPSFNCASDLFTVGYKYNPTDSILYRQAKKGGQVFSNAEWAPFLEHVTQFDWNYGIFQRNLNLLPTMTFNNGAADWYISPSVAGGGTVPSGVQTNASRPWTVSTRTNATVTAVYTTLPLTAAGISPPVTPEDSARNENLIDTATYRVSFNVAANADFFNATNGLASNAFVTAGFFTNNGTATGTGRLNTFTFRPVAGASHFVQYDVVPTLHVGPVYFGVTFQLQAAAAVDRSLTISDLKIVRLNRGRYKFQSVAPASLAQVQGLQLQLQAKSSSSASEIISFDRIIPMVNNGL